MWYRIGDFMALKNDSCVKQKSFLKCGCIPYIFFGDMDFVMLLVLISTLYSSKLLLKFLYTLLEGMVEIWHIVIVESVIFNYL